MQWRRQRKDEELDTEIQQHLDEAIRDRIARGESLDQARINAQREFGNVGLVKEVTREMWGWTSLERLWQDLRFGQRMLRMNPSFTLAAVLTLALGIGATTAIFGLFDKLLLRKLPVSRPDELMLITSEINMDGQQSVNNIFSWRDYEDFQQVTGQLGGLAGIAASTFMGGEVKFGLTAAEAEPQRVRGMFVSGNYFNVFGVAATAGRLIGADDCRDEGGHPVVVLSHAFWQKQFGGDAQVIGRQIALNKIEYTVIGVAAREFVGTGVEGSTVLWMPLTQMRQLSKTSYRGEDSFLQLVGRLAPGVTMSQAQTQLSIVAQAALEKRLTAAELANPYNQKKMRLDSLAQGVSSLRERRGTLLKLMLGMAALLLLTACANVATLLLARAHTRRREMAVRLAVGAGRWRLIRQLLTESAWLAVLGAVLGLWLAPFLHDLILRFWLTGEERPALLASALDSRVFIFATALSVIVALLCGLIPAWQSSRTDLVHALKDAVGASVAGRRRWNVRHALIVVQLSLAVIVLTGAGLFVRSLQQILNLDSGMQVTNIYALGLELPQKVVDPNDKNASQRLEMEYYNRLAQVAERARALPGAQAVSLSGLTPFDESSMMYSLLIEGREAETADLSVDTNCVAPGLHEMLGIPVLQGRSFTATDTLNTPLVATINEAFARRYFPNNDAIGQRIKLDEKSPGITIVGVTRNTRFHHIKVDTVPSIDFPLAQLNTNGNSGTLLIKAEPAAWTVVLAGLRAAVRELEPDATLRMPNSLAKQFEQHLAGERMAASLASLFGASALLMAALGLYGVMAYAVGQRTHELGIRLALGARAGDLRWLVLRDGLRLTATGLLIGLGSAAALTRWLASELYELRPLDPISFAGAASLLVLVALLACWMPARRATKVDPMIALRCE